ncbi:uncharacterized protein LOC133195827 isoform X2 [Saccostrea echinata]|uniref:uncharacterized protein LOC133195827 isoform X2 n=1 Tax=Saccostrea echinata TaxID=191078 RepID=UPI002A80922A|nr:uncharacterized protein LOC133195827 isoform X2 [Saccostrea echinata]
MNWMGGARSRIKQQGDKKIQKQFFERKRLMKRNENLNPGFQTPLGRKSAISQDIKSFCLLEQMHSSSKEMLSTRENPRPVRKIEMNMPKISRKRMTHHSSLGSSPPFNTPSKLLLMEPKHQRDTSWKRISDRKDTASMDHMLTKGNIKSKLDFGICSKINSTAHEKSTFQQENPYIPEDFQPTPVVQYLKDGHGNCMEKLRQHGQSSEVFLPSWTPASVKHNTFRHKGDGKSCKNKDFNHKFCQNPFFETPIECTESKRRKLEVNTQQESKRVLFHDSNILNKCFLKENKGRIKNDGSSPILKRSSILDTQDSYSLDSRFHQTVNGLQTSASKTVSKGRQKTFENLKFKSPLDKPLDKESRLCLSPTNMQRKLNTPNITDQMKQNWYTAHTPGNLLTSTERHSGARNSKYTKKHDIVHNSRNLYEHFDNNCEVIRSNINSRDEMSLLMTSTPVDIRRKPLEIVISPISHTAKKSLLFNEEGFHSNQTISEASVSNKDKQVSCHTSVIGQTGDGNSCDKDQSFSEKSTNHLEEDIAEILAEMDQLEEDQVKEWEFSVYYSQTQSEKDNEIGKMDDFFERKYDALIVLKAAAAKLEKYVEHYEATDFDADNHKENDLSICSNQNETQHAKEQCSLPKLQTNGKEQNSVKQPSEDLGSSVQNTTVVKEETGNAQIHCYNSEIQRNANLSDSGEIEIALRTASQITNNTESCNQMSSSCTNDKKCKCSDLFVLRSSKESQTEIYVRSTGIETDVINAVSVGIQCDLLLDGCDCKLEAPESQDSFHSVASDLHFENTNQNNYHLRSRKKI